jgi:hypothetical protein
VVVAVLPAPRHRASDRHRQRNRMPHNARAEITMGALAFAAASMAASRWRCATAARWSCRRICFAMPGPSGRPTSTAGRGFGKSFFDQFVRGKNWSLDKPSPFETARVRHPAPDMSLVSGALIKSNPELKDIWHLARSRQARRRHRDGDATAGRSLASRGKTQAELPHAPRLRGEHQLTRLGRVRASGGSSPTGALERDHSCKS